MDSEEKKASEKVFDVMPPRIAEWALKSVDNYNRLKNNDIPPELFDDYQPGTNQTGSGDGEEIKGDADIQVDYEKLGVPEHFVKDGLVEIKDGKIEGKFTSYKDYLDDLKKAKNAAKERGVIDDKDDIVPDPDAYNPDENQAKTINSLTQEKLDEHYRPEFEKKRKEYEASFKKKVEDDGLLYPESKEEWDDLKEANPALYAQRNRYKYPETQDDFVALQQYDPDLASKMTSDFNSLRTTYTQTVKDYNKTRGEKTQMEEERMNADVEHVGKLLGIKVSFADKAKKALAEKYIDAKTGMGDPRYYENVNGVTVVRSNALANFIINEMQDDLQAEIKNRQTDEATKIEEMKAKAMGTNGSGPSAAGMASYKPTDVGALPSEKELHSPQWQDKFIEGKRIQYEAEGFTKSQAYDKAYGDIDRLFAQKKKEMQKT